MELFSNETFLMVGGLVAAFLAGFFGYFKRPKEMSRVDPVIAGVGLGYGSQEQMDRLVAETKRCADQLTILAAAFVDEKTDSINDRLDETNDSINKLAKTVEGLLTARRNR